MTFPKALALIALLVFGTVAIAAFLKEGKEPLSKNADSPSAPVEIELERETVVIASPPSQHISEKLNIPLHEETVKTDELPNTDRIAEFFNKGEPKFPIVETITYKSKVPWQKGRPAWLSDYASYYQTSRHFIARSLNGKADYFKQDLVEGDRFNVLRKDKNVGFYLVIDLSRCKMWFYYEDLEAKERVLVKTYQVGVGRIDGSKPSGLLTPIGKYTLGDRIAIYKPNMKGFHNGEQVEMIGVFGSRWIPFEKEISGCSAPAKGFGIHGLPWVLNKSGERVQDLKSLGKYQSDGCIRLATEDIEELFSIIITKPTIVELVKNR